MGCCDFYLICDACGWRCCCCCCCCSPSETYGRKWGDSNFQILTELPVPPQAAGVVGTFNVFDIYIYILLSTTVSHFWTLRMPFVFTMSPFLYTFPFSVIFYRAAPTDTNPKNLELAPPQSVTATRLDQLVYSANYYIQIFSDSTFCPQ